MTSISPAFRCMYCGEERRELLTDEHILPESLEGDIILPKSSCLECNKSTSSFEQYVTRNMIGDMRVARGMRTKRPKERPSHLTIQALDENGELQFFEIPADKHPGPYLALFYDLPLLISGSKIWSISVRAAFTEDVDDIKSVLGVKTVEMPMVFDVARFSQFIAKIAHGFFCYKLGIDGFKPYLAEFIKLKKNEIDEYVNSQSGDYRNFIGGIDIENSIERKVHNVKLQLERIKGKTMCVAYLSLFANFKFKTPDKVFSSPTYLIIVGEKNHKTLARWRTGKNYYDCT